MKSIFTIFALSFSLINLNALASPIPKDKLAAYQEAVNLAINQHPLKCVFYTDRPEWNPEVSSGLTQAISATTSGDLNSDGDQPVLTFSNQSDAQFRDVFYVTTSADYRDVLSVEREQSEKATKEVNLGTIENPQIVWQTSWIETVTAICQ